MKPQEPIPHNYSMRTLNWIFAVSSLVLLLLTFALIAYDYSNGWRRFQLEFLNLQKQRITGELKTATAAQNKAEIAKLDEDLRKQEVELAKRRRDYRDAQQRLEKWEGKHYAADQDYRFAKAVLDAQRYEAEAAVQQKRNDAPSKVKTYETQRDRVEVLKVELEEVVRQRDAARASFDRLLAGVKEIEDRKKAITASIDLLNKQLKTVDETDPGFIALNRIPLLDFVAPTMKVDQVVMNELFVDVNFMHVPRVDRCTTCHRAIDRPGWESKKESARLQAELEQKLETFQIPPEQREEVAARIEKLKRAQTIKSVPNPYRTHPFLDQFVGSASPHPLLEYGCTACHRGQDRATQFARAGHMPVNHKQEERWIHRRGWKPQPYLETPMYPRQHMEGSCLKCHSEQITIPYGKEVTKGTAMVELYGCFACHKINTWRFSNLRKPGPDLTGLAEKTTPQWAIRWITEPHDFRATTRMPSFFYQRNMIGPGVEAKERQENIKFQNAEIHSIVSFLFAKSTRRTWQAPSGLSGDATRGAQLAATVGCLGCHITEDTVKDEKTGAIRPVRREEIPLERQYGFNLSGTGTKVNPAWLFNWLKDPNRYYADAPMPDLRLSDQEAADLVAWLMSLQKPEFMQKQVPLVDREALAKLTKSYLINTMTDRDAEQRLAGMSFDQKLVYLGERSVEKYGCYSCHTIKGFDDAKPIGTELTIEGSKTLHLFDFGFVHDYEAHDGLNVEGEKGKEHVIHTVPSWIYTKLREPRVWDDDRAKAYNDKLRMPNFHLSPKEATTIATVVLGQTKERVAQTKYASRNPLTRVAEEGRKLVSQRNCRGCHIVQGYGRAIEPTITDAAMLPPDLTPEGGRAQSPWLFAFLKDPTVLSIRPWLGARMPTFHFTDEEANTFVQYFAAEGKIAQFDSTRTSQPPARNIAVGKAVFEILKCAQCHPTGPGVQVTQDASSLAPSLYHSRVRLRYDWIADWIRRPNEMIPGTRMPTNFPRDAETGGFVSPIGDAINTPQFAAYRGTLRAQFNSDEEMLAVMKDPVALTDYLRDYIWSIGPAEMRSVPQNREAGPAPVPATPAQVPPPAPLRAQTAGASRTAAMR